MKTENNPSPKSRLKKMKKIYILPNLFTTGNMFCGFYAIVSAIHGSFLTAAWAVLAGILFDSMDGRVARLTRATSAFGVQYDSLSDLLSFGCAPALLIYLWGLETYGRMGWLSAFVYVVCAALRLARFNVLVDQVPKSYFQGMPSPLAASSIATIILFSNDRSFDWTVQAWGSGWVGQIMAGSALPRSFYLLFVPVVLGFFMISTVRFPSFKEFKMNKENSFAVLAFVVLLLVLIAIRPEVTLFFMGIVYICVSFVFEVYRVLFQGALAKSGRLAHDVSFDE